MWVHNWTLTWLENALVWDQWIFRGAKDENKSHYNLLVFKFKVFSKIDENENLAA